MDELRYAVRSAVAHIPNLRTVHIISPDFPGSSLASMAASLAAETNRSVHDIVADYADTYDAWYTSADGLARIGQKPIWLAEEASNVLTGVAAERSPRPNSDSSVQLRLHHDWSVFGLWKSTNGVQRKHIASPTFNSMAIESVMDPLNLPGLAETALFANDDFFIMRDLSAADIQSPLYGLVVRMQDDWGVVGKQYNSWKDSGEWPGLQRTNYVLDERFGKKLRRYSAHFHRSLSRSLLHESKLIFREDVAAATRTRFRGLGLNLISHYLAWNMIIERHREAMLWIYIVMKLDSNGDGLIDEQEMLTFKSSFSPLTTEGALKGVIYRPRRTSLQQDRMDDNHRKVGLDPAKATEYRFISLDGYPFATFNGPYSKVWGWPDAQRFGNRLQARWGWGSVNGWPYYVPHKGERATEVCSIVWDECIGKLENGTLSSTKMFTRIAFENPQCGDCCELILVILEANPLTP